MKNVKTWEISSRVQARRLAIGRPFSSSCWCAEVEMFAHRTSGVAKWVWCWQHFIFFFYVGIFFSHFPPEAMGKIWIKFDPRKIFSFFFFPWTVRPVVLSVVRRIHRREKLVSVRWLAWRSCARWYRAHIWLPTWVGRSHVFALARHIYIHLSVYL